MSLKTHTQTLRTTLHPSSLHPGAASPLIPPDFTPTTELSVSFSSRAVELGTFFRAGECKAAPRISFPPEADSSVAVGETSYTFILTDPDAPTPDDPKFAFWRHWVVAGLKPGIYEENGEGEGRTLTKYLGPGPKDDSKPHRYLFLLYREPPNFTITPTDVGGEEFVQRRSFRPDEFAARHGLKLVGVNWMTCAGDGWVAPSPEEK
ncbi:PEBP-like protein [Hypoxylon trugodes]|uniref:PEBP-like protein n=1 Tax=Hypoxylon trugodes TaxID=326681 RepID=UPI00219317AE|nr:PEBP-like protein [Hypoxylon trugodes]KAI1384048.1 PEBP-like protein [Hypoxylon trugodes]